MKEIVMIREIIEILRERGFRHAPDKRESILRGEYVTNVSREVLYGRNFSIIKASIFETLAKNDEYRKLYFITKRNRYEKELYLEETEANIKMLAELFVKECGKK